MTGEEETCADAGGSAASAAISAAISADLAAAGIGDCCANDGELDIAGGDEAGRCPAVGR
jgi:hypothetical protein